MTRPARLPRYREQDHERSLVCIRCEATILVCGYVSDLDARTFVGLACGCRRPKTDAQIAADRQVQDARKTHDPIPF